MFPVTKILNDLNFTKLKTKKLLIQILATRVPQRRGMLPNLFVPRTKKHFVLFY